ncbi:hypothetical protein [Rhizorhabdus dicambivorans]|uniref:Uncharacterized protein n=1 Tax=Rhizorhabdus dicambivorans TaxID=1850238 RepID=A0A2A4FV97_9SPHN|nr:hypothetical protein [Rhizorhabdus dicambivorans]ATE64512.1 hypothetical protein CMV14_08955 [Rhizorhabdus dicambivorans]PCE41606.1 hypothetical protein COO09_13885 [Rhizorhabdus dicambivorans]
MIRALLSAALTLAAAGSAQAGQEVPPPRPIRPVETALAALPPAPAAVPHGWRETPPVIGDGSPDRFIAVADFGWDGGCGTDEDWGEEEDFADAGFPAWEEM